MKTLKNTLLTGAALATAASTQTAMAEIKFDAKNPTDIANLQGSGASAEIVISGWLANLTNLLYFVALVFALYGAFQVLTAGENDDKVGNGKKIITNALLGLLAIFIANSLLQFIFSFFITPA